MQGKAAEANRVQFTDTILKVLMENFSKQVNASLAALRAAYDQQGQTGKILVAALLVFGLCCLCAVPLGLLPGLRGGGSATAVPSPVLFPTQQGGPTPTALFDFDFPTFTPFPTLPFATALPTLTSPPTTTPLPTSTAPPATGAALPTVTPPLPSPTVPPPVPTSSASVQIVLVDKPREFVDIQNRTNAAVDLRGWRLVSETGNQSCPLRGTLQPNDVLRIWARRGEPGIDCRFDFNIWNDNTPDAAVLYNAQGEEVSRFP